VTEDSAVGEAAREVARLDTSVPQSARVWNYFLGGKDNFAVDRAAGDQYRMIFPDIITIARADRAFLGRAVRYLAGEAGIRQFLDIGTGLPTLDNTHEVAQRVAPTSRIVYVDNDPMVLAHARALLTSTPEGATTYVEADLREPERILEAAAQTLDLTRPVAVMLLGILHFVADLDEVRAILNRLLDAVPAGSYVALTHATLELGGQANAEAQASWNEKAAVPLTPRTREQLSGLLHGLEVLEPGIVSMNQWRPDENVERGADGSPVEAAGWCAVARKP
jgi:O-methyltransferase involved in polyketide biosynthesis